MFADVNTSGEIEKLLPSGKYGDAGTSRDYEQAGSADMHYNAQEQRTTPKQSQRQLQTDRVEIAIQTEIDSEPSRQVHCDREGRRSTRHGSPSTYYMHSVRLYSCTHIN